jgi:hypothetical protein
MDSRLCQGGRNHPRPSGMNGGSIDLHRHRIRSGPGGAGGGQAETFSQAEAQLRHASMQRRQTS